MSRQAFYFENTGGGLQKWWGTGCQSHLAEEKSGCCRIPDGRWGPMRNKRRLGETTQGPKRRVGHMSISQLDWKMQKGKPKHNDVVARSPLAHPKSNTGNTKSDEFQSAVDGTRQQRACFRDAHSLTSAAFSPRFVSSCPRRGYTNLAG